MDQNGREYVTIEDGANGPTLSVADLLQPVIAQR
jgi:hypothetical protein